MNIDTEAEATTLQEGAADADNQEAERPKTKRELDMEAIAQSRTQHFETESGVKLSDDGDPGDGVDDQVAQQLEEPAARVLSADEPVKIKTKVDGEEREVDLSEIVRTYQKDTSADKRLKEATRLLKEAEERAEQLAAQTREPDPKPAEPVENDADLVAKVKLTLSKLYSGEEDAAAAELVGLIKGQGGTQPTQTAPEINIDQLADQLQQRLAVQNAFATVEQDYPEIIANPDIETLTAMKVNQRVAAGTPRAQAIIESAKEVYASLGFDQKGRQADDAANSVREEKLKQKSERDQVRSAHAAAVTPAEPSESNASALIQEIASRRLGQTMTLRQ